MSGPTDTNTSLYIPWGWSVTPVDDGTHHTCPPPSAILGTFAVVNAAVGIISIIFGHRRVTKTLTCKLFGHMNSTSWMWMWIPIVGLQLGANTLVAKIIHLTPGYEQNFKTWELTLFFTARPRISWILGLPLSHILRHRSPRKYYHDGKDYAWRCFALSQFIAEIVLQLITAYTMGTTVAFAARHGYYILGNLTQEGQRAHMMYSAALYWLCGQSVLLVVGIAATVCSLRYTGDYSKRMHVIMTYVGVAMLPLSWMATWLFWAGYVRLAGNQ
ncbi:MAG: hypothetical protein M1839_004759 [Geoglossum umbratile]|nr:MAG: hypothetical protein M1839_004759 [Geoglossum umbratile]